MAAHNDTQHKQKQVELIDVLVKQVEENNIQFSTVEAVNDFAADPRLCLTGVHFLNSELREKLAAIIAELRQADASPYYYPLDSLHLTIKNVRTIGETPNFSETDVPKAQQAFNEVASQAKPFKSYFYRFIVFPTSLSLVGTTDPERDDITIDLDAALNKVGVPDDKKYINTKYFFANITVARFSQPISKDFRKALQKISAELSIPPYTVDSVSLVTANAAMLRRKVIQTWQLS